MGKKTSIYIGNELMDKLGLYPYGNKTPLNAIHTTIDRYSYLISCERTYIRKLFTEQEWELMRAVCSGVSFTSADKVPGAVLRCIYDAHDIEFKLLKVDKLKLCEKFNLLTMVQQFVIVEEIELFWEKQHSEAEELKHEN